MSHLGRTLGDRLPAALSHHQAPCLLGVEAHTLGHVVPAIKEGRAAGIIKAREAWRQHKGQACAALNNTLDNPTNSCAPVEAHVGQQLREETLPVCRRALHAGKQGRRGVPEVK